jgi:hypothetical protein
MFTDLSTALGPLAAGQTLHILLSHSFIQFAPFQAVAYFDNVRLEQTAPLGKVPEVPSSCWVPSRSVFSAIAGDTDTVFVDDVVAAPEIADRFAAHGEELG